MKAFLLPILSGIIIFSACNNQSDYKVLKDENLKLHFQLDSLNKKIDSLNAISKMESEIAHQQRMIAEQQRRIADSVAIIARMQADSAQKER